LISFFAAFAGFWIFLVFGAAAFLAAGFSFWVPVDLPLDWLLSFGSDFGSDSVLTGTGSWVEAFWTAFDFSAFFALTFSSWNCCFSLSWTSCFYFLSWSFSSFSFFKSSYLSFLLF
jgi:hypothetical protein